MTSQHLVDFALDALDELEIKRALVDFAAALQRVCSQPSTQHLVDLRAAAQRLDDLLFDAE